MDKPLPAEQATGIPAAPSAPRVTVSFWPITGLLFAIATVSLPFLGLVPGDQSTLSIIFFSIVLEGLPFVMIGALIGGLIEVFLSRERVTALIPKNDIAAVFVAGLMGILIPVCECAVIPVTRRLLRKGVPFAAAVAYLLAGPIVNPIVASSTAVAYGGDWSIVVVRLLAGYGVAVAVGLVVGEMFPGTKALLASWTAGMAADQHAHGHDHNHDHGDAESCADDTCSHGHAHGDPRAPWYRRVLTAFGHAADDFILIGQFLVIGAFLAGLSQTLISREDFLALGQTPSAAIALMMGLAVLLNLCSEADAFVAASFQSSLPGEPPTLPVAAQMAFMVLGPMLDLKLVAMYLTFVRKRALTVMIVLMVTFVFTLMLMYHYARTQ